MPIILLIYIIILYTIYHILICHAYTIYYTSYTTSVGISVGELREILREVSVRPAEEQGPDEEAQWDSYFDQALYDL